MIKTLERISRDISLFAKINKIFDNKDIKVIINSDLLEVISERSFVAVEIDQLKKCGLYFNSVGINSDKKIYLLFIIQEADK